MEHDVKLPENVTVEIDSAGTYRQKPTFGEMQYSQAVPVSDEKDVAAAIDRLTERLSDILSGMYDMQVDIRDALREYNLREKNRG